MEFKSIGQISKDNAHRTLIVGLIFGKESTTMKYWFKSVYCISDRIALLFNDFKVLLSNAFIFITSYRISESIYSICKNPFNEIMMEFKNIRQISKDNTHNITSGSEIWSRKCHYEILVQKCILYH